MKSFTSSMAMMALLLTSPFLAVDEVSAAPTVTSGNLQTSKSTKCLSVESLSNGSKVRVASCASNAKKQTFQFMSSVSRSNTLLKASSSVKNLCLDLPNGIARNGAQVQVWTCDSTNVNQYWNRVGNNIRFKATNYCLDIADGQASGFADGQVVQIWTCNYSSVNQNILGPVQVSTAPTTSSVVPVVPSTSSKAQTTSSSSVVKTSSSVSSTKASSTVASSTKSSIAVPSSTKSSSTVVSTTKASSTPTKSSSSSSSSSSSTVRATSTKSSSTTESSATIVAPTTASASTTSTTVTSSSTTSATPTPTTTIQKQALTSFFKPTGKRMLAWGYDDRRAVEISSGPLISSYHHWENLKVKQMNPHLTYIPTYWGHAKNDSWEAVKAQLGDEVPLAVAGFNEPDIATQANMDPITAANSFYQNIDLYYGRRGSNTIAPAIAWNVDGWLVPFMNQCKLLGCQIDAVGLHIYLDLNDDVDGAVAQVQQRVNLVYARTGKPIVLSELGLTAKGGGTADQMADFVAKAGAFLDNSPIVAAWALSAVFAYGAGWDTYLNSNLAFFNTNGTLRDLAYQFMYNSSSSSS